MSLEISDTPSGIEAFSERGRLGTRFRLYPQTPDLDDPEEPETVYVSSPAGTISEGPADDRMYTVFPIDKPTHYGLHDESNGEPVLFLPPWTDDIIFPAQPGEDGHFDHLEPNTPEFFMAHMFGATRFTLDIWEGYFGRRIDWHFRDDYDRLEISIIPKVDNAFLGWGFLEAGGMESEGKYSPFFLNFDIIAHEVGHAIVYSEIGMPSEHEEEPEYFGFQESMADVVALLASLHFDSVITSLLNNTSGNLYTYNKLSRFAEMSDNNQIRLAANDRVMSEFVDGWDDEHKLAQPLTGAMFDILVDLFHEHLLELGLIPPEMEEMSDRLEGDPAYSSILQDDFDKFYALNPEGFKQALETARDQLGTFVADAIPMFGRRQISFAEFGKALEEVDQELTGGQNYKIIHRNFLIREIGQFDPGPRLKKPDKHSHSLTDRTISPRDLD